MEGSAIPWNPSKVLGKKTLKIMCKEAFFGMAIILDPCLGYKTSWNIPE